MVDFILLFKGSNERNFEIIQNNFGSAVLRIRMIKIVRMHCSMQVNSELAKFVTFCTSTQYASRRLE